MYVYVPHLFPSIFQWTLEPLQVLAIVKSADMNIKVHVSFQFMLFSGYMPIGSYGSFIFNF